MNSNSIWRKNTPPNWRQLYPKKLAVTLTKEGDYVNEYDFETPSVPFAYRIERLKNFTG